jgi:hypothetical protein
MTNRGTGGGPGTTKFVPPQNQTRPAWEREPGLGTGVFLVVDPKIGRGRKKALVPRLTYKECCVRGAASLFFKWVPESVLSYDALLAMADDPCEENGCQVDPTSCPGTCICHSDGYCHQD